MICRCTIKYFLPKDWETKLLLLLPPGGSVSHHTARTVDPIFHSSSTTCDRPTNSVNEGSSGIVVLTHDTSEMLYCHRQINAEHTRRDHCCKGDQRLDRFQTLQITTQCIHELRLITTALLATTPYLNIRNLIHKKSTRY